eukprot:TRINITY_DN173_c0_g1_i1.p1 TRINITY_DN173_c0_g1~~TRINITY_DN173_c0_g1_i1.p1  ORF type:complete len:281 (-),score=44.46 TRINITY_DN173_c0_g1_i1:302-1144(-)
MGSTMPSHPLFGGIPTNDDIAPSAIFLVLFTLTTPLLFWRLINKETRIVLLIRPTIYCFLRIATYIVRIILAKGNHTIGVIIAQMLLFSLSFVVICEPLVVLLSYNVYPYVTDESRRTIKRIISVCRIGLIIAIIVGILAGTKTYDSLTNPDAASLVYTYKKVSTSLIICVVGSVFLTALATFFGLGLKEKPPVKSSGYVLLLSSILSIPCAYRVAQLASTSYGDTVNHIATFYVVNCLFEWIYITLYTSINIPKTYEVGIQIVKETTSSCWANDSTPSA